MYIIIVSLLIASYVFFIKPSMNLKKIQLIAAEKKCVLALSGDFLGQADPGRGSVGRWQPRNIMNTSLVGGGGGGARAP